jgi:hypothetical protein
MMPNHNTVVVHVIIVLPIHVTLADCLKGSSSSGIARLPSLALDSCIFVEIYHLFRRTLQCVGQ